MFQEVHGELWNPRVIMSSADNWLLGQPLFKWITNSLCFFLLSTKQEADLLSVPPSTHNQLESWIDTSSLSAYRHRPSQWGGVNTNTAVGFWVFPLSWLIIFRTVTENIQQSSGNFSGIWENDPSVLTAWRDCITFSTLRTAYTVLNMKLMEDRSSGWNGGQSDMSDT